MKTTCGLSACLSSLMMLLPTVGNCVSDPDLLAGDIAQIAVPAAALAITWHFDDATGRWQLLKTYGSTMAANYALKIAFNHSSLGTRPNGGNQSFPSGHTASSCAGAFFLQRRYGSAWGSPALAAAAFTGYSRVDEHYHHTRDVVAGCALAWSAAWLFTDKHLPEGISLLPAMGNNNYALTVQWRY